MIRTGIRPDDWQDAGPANGTAGPGMAFRVEPVYRETEPRVSEPRTRSYAPDPRCVLTGRCRHRECVSRRVGEARKLHTTTNLTLTQIGRLLGRDHSTVSYWLNEYRDKAA